MSKRQRKISFDESRSNKRIKLDNDETSSLQTSGEDDTTVPLNLLNLFEGIVLKMMAYLDIHDQTKLMETCSRFRNQNTFQFTQSTKFPVCPLKKILLIDSNITLV